MKLISHQSESVHTPAAAITWAASKQTYFTVRFLVDRDRIADAYRAYGYFRWLDDQLDGEVMGRPARIAFVERQKALMESCFRGEWPCRASVEERMLVDLIRGDPRQNSGLRVYIREMMAVMDFDAHRRGRLIGQEELAEYSRSLARAVTEALHYFVGHGCTAPHSEARYLAATGAHIAHMLRDTLDDAAAGYFNVPRDLLEAHAITPQDVGSDAYRAWVKGRVQMAHTCFEAGKVYLSQVENLRCRIAGYAYIARFVGVLDAIERDGYRLRNEYPECKSLRIGIASGWSVLSLALNRRRREVAPHALLSIMKTSEGKL
ncbi:MAG: squalene/phytoene synthase family protein [Chloroflexi bacterium]|nr:squalene/phytoene synthase family protein [Chloroflexota bacterium]